MTILNVQDYGAKGDGSADDRPAIQAAIDDASDGDTIYIPEPPEHYRIENSNAGEGVLIVDGDRHANNITIEGDGESTVFKMADGVSSTYRMIRILRPNNYSLTIRDLVWDGNRQNASSSSGAIGAAIEFRSTGASGTGDMLVEDVEVRNCLTNGIVIQYGGVRINRVSTHHNHGHGIAVHTDSSGHHDPAAHITNTHSYKNAINGGRYAIDVSGGKGIVENCVLEDSINGGGTKVSNGIIHAEYRRVRVRNNPSLAFQCTGDGKGATVVFDDIVFDSNGVNVRLDDEATYVVPDGSWLVATGHDDDRGQIYIPDAPKLDAGKGNIASTHTTGYGLNCQGASSAEIGRYCQYANGKGSLGETKNLTIHEEVEQEMVDLDNVPTGDEVGAWTDGSGTEDETQETEPKPTSDSWTPRWASTEDDWSIVSDPAFEGDHALRFAHDGTSRTRYALSWDAVGEPSDVEVLDKFRVPKFTEDESLGFHARVNVRSSIENSEENGYWIEIEDREDAFRLAKYTDGDLTTLARFGTPAENTFFYRRFRAEGDTLKAKVWETTELEPSDWDVEVTDSDHTDGWVGLGSFDTGVVETDVFSVGVDGESAPGPFSEVSEPPSVAWVEPDDGGAVSESQPIAIGVSNSDEDPDSLTVEYRVDEGDWSEASYDSDSDSYVGIWDTTTVKDDTYSLEARTVDAGTTVTEDIEVTVENGVVVESKLPREVTESTATLVGELVTLGSEDAACYFEWRAADSDEWNATETQSMESTGEFDAELGGLEAGIEYEFRAVADGSEENTGQTVPFNTSSGENEDEGSEGDELSIDRFRVSDRSNPTWTWYDIDWAVSDPGGELDTIVTELRYEGTTVAADSSSVSGEAASFSHDLRVRGDVDEVRLSVNDTSNETRTQTESV